MRWSPFLCATFVLNASRCSYTYSLLSGKLRARRLITAPVDMHWVTICKDKSQLRPDNTMVMGQCFNWHPVQSATDPTWTGVLSGTAMLVRQDDHCTQFLSLTNSISGNETNTDCLRKYFQLDHDLSSLYQQWNAGCERMKAVTEVLQGVRVVRQDPWECLISFICSSNNNNSRITQMLTKLRTKYGTHLCTLTLSKRDKDAGADLDSIAIPIAHPQSDDAEWVMHSPGSASLARLAQHGEVLERFDLYSFPTVDALADAAEEDLRALGMGYRAKFIIGSAQLVREKCRRLAELNGEVTGTSWSCDDGKYWFNELRAVAAATTTATGRPVEVLATDTATVKIEIEDETAVSPGTKKEKGKKADTSKAGPKLKDASIESLGGRLWVQQQLMELPGVGRKVADCVALFSLDQAGAVPVDTHVWNIAIRDYAPHLRRAEGRATGGATPLVDDRLQQSPPGRGGGKRGAEKEVAGADLVDSPSLSLLSPSVTTAPQDATPSGDTPGGRIETKSLTPALYEQVGQVFRDRFGPYAGWAHSVLFAAELPQFRARLPEDLQQQMRDFVDLQRSAKKAQREDKNGKRESSKVGTPTGMLEELEGERIESGKRSKRK